MSRSTLRLAVFGTVLFVFCIAINVSSAFAQSQASTGQIAGSVRDSAGAAIPNAKVKASNSDTGLERTATTSADGLFRMVLLPPGTYTVSADASGFGKATLSGVEVSVGRTTDTNLALGVGKVEETVTVTALGIQTTSSAADSLVNVNAISNLPINGRRFQDFVTLTPTAQVEPSRGQISLSGQRGINSNISVDGTDYNQPFFGGIRGGERSNFAPTIPQESIQEFQVVAAGYAAEFGRSTGGIVNAVTKSGTNGFHGSAFYLHRPRQWVRNHEFFDQLSQFLGKPVNAAPTQQQWGGSFGGPIKKDRTFFFGSYEQQRVRNPREVFFDQLPSFTPTAATQEAYDYYKSLQQTFAQTNDSKTFMVRLDHQFSESNRFNVRYNRSKYEGINATSVGNALFPTISNAVSNNGTELDETNTVAAQLTSFFGANLVNELRGQYSRERRPRLANAKQPTVSSNIGTFGTVSFLGENVQKDWRFQIFNNLTWIMGNHTVKFGAEVNHTYADQTFGFNQYGAFNISGTANGTILDILSYTPAITTGIVNRFDSTDVSYNRQIGNLKVALDVDEFSIFAQDSWRVRPNFTLNFGLRWEEQFNPAPEANNDSVINRIRNLGRFPSGHLAGRDVNPALIPDSGSEFGPRLGFAWDPFKSGKTVVRGYSGIYYARTPMLLFTAPLNNFRVPAGDLSLALPILGLPAGNPNNTVYKQLKLIGIDLNNFTLDKLPIITPEQVQSIAQALGLSVDPFNGANVILMAQDFKNPMSYQLGGGVEREILTGLTLSADFSWVNTLRLERHRDINIPLPVLRSTAVDPAQRPFFGLRTGTQRPLASLGSITYRESTAHSLYRALTVQARFQRKWAQINANYTLSKLLTNDDNERDATGFRYENCFNLAPEYADSSIDRRHQFGAATIFNLPYGFEISNGIRLRSGAPIDVAPGNTDPNGDRGGPDRPYSAPGVPFKRNAFRNRAIYGVDMRVQKGIHLGESRELSFSVEFFNLFNLQNITYSGSVVTNYCAAPQPADCGFTAPTNPNFLKLIDQNPTSTRLGKLLLNNNPGEPFQVQVGARFKF